MTEMTPDQIRLEIDRTRADLSGTVDTLTEKVNPGRAMGRQVHRTRTAVVKAKERVMGSYEDARDGVSSAASTVADAAGNVAQAAGSVPEATRKQAQGSPLAAALIAFGAGWLVSSILPASRPEQQLAAQAKDKAAELAQPVLRQAKQAGEEMADHLKEPAKQAVEQVRSTAQDAASTVTDQARHSAGDVRDEARAQSRA